MKLNSTKWTVLRFLITIAIEIGGRKTNCNGTGSGCYGPHFINSDGVVLYFQGRKDEYFTLISNPNLQINACFIGIQPAGRTPYFAWIQALGIKFSSHLTLTMDATKTKLMG